MPEQTLATHSASSSTSQPVTTAQTWRERLRLHFPTLANNETDEGMCFIIYGLFQSMVLHDVSSIPAKTLLSETLKPGSQKEVSTEELTVLFEAIEVSLKDQNDLKLNTLLHYCLPSQLAKDLYNYALRGSNSIPILHWALICHQPITSSMLIGITAEQLNHATKFAANINTIDALFKLKELNKELDLTDACLIAINRKFHYLVEKLLELGVDTQSAESPLLHAAIRTNNIDMAKLLIKYHANINAIVSEESPLHLAVLCADVAMTNLLLEHGANIHLPAKTDCMTALHLAFVYQCPEILCALLSTAQPELALFSPSFQSPFDPKIEAAKNEEWNRTSSFNFFQPAPEVDSEKKEGALSQELS